MGISAIYTAHDYHPMGQFYIGENKVKEAIENCKAPLLSIMKMISDNPESSDEQIAALFNKNGNLPKLGAHVVEHLRKLV